MLFTLTPTLSRLGRGGVLVGILKAMLGGEVWIPAFAGMTGGVAGVTGGVAGMTGVVVG